ncbi:esterase/lipase family protein [Kitasatospora sp. NPDC057223]|uniref:esterase/lipase family protein n=1 Tax=Kitasatospora sp. NPDC057223 TaxID=3346055 RepID=UPI00362E05A4
MKLRLAGITLAAVAVSVIAVVAPASAVDPGLAPAAAPAPRILNTGLAQFAAALAKSHLDPMMSPPGANDWTCRPTAAHPRAVVLVHGTWANAYDSWAGLSPVLKGAGYCVFALNFGAPEGDVYKAAGPIPDSAKEVAAFVDQVLTATGTDQVDLVGHSQGGGLLPRWYLKFEGGAAKTHRLVGISPSNHGTTASGLAALAEALHLIDATAQLVGQAAKDQLVGSDVNTRLDAGGDTVPGVRYTTIVTRTDEVVTPYRQQYLTAGPGATVENLNLQDACPFDVSGHLAITYSTVMYRTVLNSLDPQHTQPATCRS